MEMQTKATLQLTVRMDITQKTQIAISAGMDVGQEEHWHSARGVYTSIMVLEIFWVCLKKLD